MVANTGLFSLLGSPASKLLILQTGTVCSGPVPAVHSSLISEHVSTEALLSCESQKQTPLGAALRRARKAGRHPSDDTILAVMRRWFFARRTDNGFCLAGFPTTLRQAIVLDEWLDARDEVLDGCIWPAGSIPLTPAACYYRDRGLLLNVSNGVLGKSAP
jgi:adenylate kinase